MTTVFLFLLFFMHHAVAKQVVIVSVCISHLFLTEPIALGLIERGHNVTYITSVECKPRIEKLGASIYGNARWNYVPDNAVGILSLIYLSKQLINMNDIACQEVRDLVIFTKPDLILSDYFTSAVGVVAEKFNVPFAILHFGMMDISTKDNERLSLQTTVGIDDEKSALTKLISQSATAFVNYLAFSTISESANRMRKQLQMSYFFSSYCHLAVNYPSFTLLNADYQRSFKAENVTCLGIIPYDLPPMPLPDKVSKFLSESVNDVIYVAFGSELRPDYEMHKAIMSFFSKHKEGRIIYARYPYEDEIKTLPPHILAEKYIAQRSILMNKKMKIFLSHCGLNSAIEAIEAEVVVICLPLGRDQFFMSKGLVDLEMGVEVKRPINEDNIRKAFELANGRHTTFLKNIQSQKRILYGMGGLNRIEKFMDEHAMKSTRIYRDSPIRIIHRVVAVCFLSTPFILILMILFIIWKCFSGHFSKAKDKIS